MKKNTIIFTMRNSAVLYSNARVDPMAVSLVQAATGLHRLMDSGDQFHTVAFKNQILKISSRGDYTLVFILNEAFDYDEIRQIADEIGGSEDVAEAIAKYAQE